MPGYLNYLYLSLKVEFHHEIPIKFHFHPGDSSRLNFQLIIGFGKSKAGQSISVRMLLGEFVDLY